MRNDYRKIYRIVKKIPKGRVSTYGEIARLAKVKSPRIVGRALHFNPDPKNIPCHRVVNSKSMLSKNYAFGGINAQAEKLKAEGIDVKKNKVDQSLILKY